MFYGSAPQRRSQLTVSKSCAMIDSVEIRERPTTRNRGTKDLSLEGPLA
jgi:hypothetical protein